jgi:hypothetical protein
MTKPGVHDRHERDGHEHDRQEDDGKPDFLEKRGLAWGSLVALLVVTLIVALVLAYLITVHNFPAH